MSHLTRLQGPWEAAQAQRERTRVFRERPAPDPGAHPQCPRCEQLLTREQVLELARLVDQPDGSAPGGGATLHDPAARGPRSTLTRHQLLTELSRLPDEQLVPVPCPLCGGPITVLEVVDLAEQTRPVDP